MIALPADFTELVQFDAHSGAVVSREGKRLEFKEGFNAADLSDYTKVLASFANASGGVIAFGVSNKPRMIVRAKTTSNETTFETDIRDFITLEKILWRLTEGVFAAQER